jgi:hypothetical protein
MGLFKPYSQAASEPTPDPDPPKKKKVPTPKRREAELARRELLNPTLNPKAAKAREREIEMEKRGAAMQKVDAEPRRQLLRNYIDARRSPAAWTMPVIMVMLAISMFSSGWGTEAMTLTMYATWAIFLVVIIDLILIWRGYKKLLAERLPKESPKGLLSYAINRSINIRRLRHPKPQVKPGEEI